ncbi:MAG: hypothetical protein OEX22_13280 [Cyclobacteriaceae bacterium]|nr:hypothetical protein [Cyclobacteriaceae bacterium]
MKILKTLIVLPLWLLSISLFAQFVGKPFPEMETESYDDVKISLPNDKTDKYTLVGLAYSKKSEADLNSWFSPVYHKFIKEEDKGLFASFGYDINVFFIPMFTGAKATAAGTAKKKAAKGMDPRLLPHLLFYKGKLGPYKESLGLDKKDVPYFFVIDKEGKIIFATSGAYSDDKMDEIEEVLEE